MGKPVDREVGAPPAAAKAVFGTRLDRATTLAALMGEHGVDRGVIGPRELDRLWERHILNSAVVAELIPYGASVVDVGSGAGFPGIPLAIARPDLDMVLLEPMARRVDWLHEALRQVGTRAEVVRGRAEERAVRERVSGVDVVTARALAPLARLTRWCLPLVWPGGLVLALKGASVDAEISRDRGAVLAAGAMSVEVSQCGKGVVDTPATVVSMVRAQQEAGRGARPTRPRRSKR